MDPVTLDSLLRGAAFAVSMAAAATILARAPAAGWVLASTLFRDGSRVRARHWSVGGLLVVITFTGDWGRSALGPPGSHPDIAIGLLRALACGALDELFSTPPPDRGGRVPVLVGRGVDPIARPALASVRGQALEAALAARTTQAMQAKQFWKREGLGSPRSHWNSARRSTS